MESDTNRPGPEGPVTAGWGNVLTTYRADSVSPYTTSDDDPWTLPPDDTERQEAEQRWRDSQSREGSLPPQDEPTESE